MFFDEEMPLKGAKRRNNYSPSSSFSDDEYNDNCQLTIDNSENILRILKNLWIDQSMCDIYLKVGCKEYGAHRLVLCASSDVFHAMLRNSAWSEWQESHIELTELPLCEPVFYAFLEYFYTGKIHITHTNVMPILALADKYMVKSLSRICITYMSRHVPHAASHNQLSSWLYYSNASGHKLIFDTCQNYLKWNFESVANTSDFSNIDCNTFVKVLKQSDVIVHNEIVLFNCVVRWLELQKVKIEQAATYSKKNWTEMIIRVMLYIRFPMMSPRELTDLIMSPLVRMLKEFFLERMVIGVTYHHSPGSAELERYYDKEPDLFTARLYTSDSCSASLNIENFRNLKKFHISTFLFSSHISASELEANEVSQWEVGLYPRGVYFKKCYLILSQGTMEVPEEMLNTVRLSLTCRESPLANMRVKISILIYGIHGGVEHVMDIREKVHYFTAQDKKLNIDDLIPFKSLNPPDFADNFPLSPYLIGPYRDQLKLNIVIAPMK